MENKNIIGSKNINENDISINIGNFIILRSKENKRKILSGKITDFKGTYTKINGEIRVDFIDLKDYEIETIKEKELYFLQIFDDYFKNKFDKDVNPNATIKNLINNLSINNLREILESIKDEINAKIILFNAIEKPKIKKLGDCKNALLKIKKEKEIIKKIKFLELIISIISEKINELSIENLSEEIKNPTK